MFTKQNKLFTKGHRVISPLAKFGPTSSGYDCIMNSTFAMNRGQCFGNSKLYL